MPHLLTRYSFKEADLDLPEIQTFSCGPARWEQKVAAWIKSRSGDNSALEDIKNYGIQVWLYRTAQGELVGFGSLGENTWSLPMPKGPKHLINYIPFIGVHERFRGEPKDADRDDKYAYQILDDLIDCAVEKTARRADLHPAIGLSVDRQNQRAIRFYARRGFVDMKSPRTDKATKVVYDRMLVDIKPLVDALRAPSGS